MILDFPERHAALDPSRSFIVEAPAGSGKTSILVQRFLRLLSGVERPESVVAITFARKAAAEVRQRIVKALNYAALGEAPPIADEFNTKMFGLAAAVLAQDRKMRWNLLDDPGRLQIQTIDSLCALLTRQMPVLSDFGGVNEVIEEASELYLRAARETLTTLAEGDAESNGLFHRMVLHFDNNVATLEGHLITMLGKRDQWEHLSGDSGDQLVHDCCQLLSRAEAQLRLVFQRAGKVDFTEIARAARHALGRPEQPSDLLYSLDYRFEHLLVDEFQDTSRSQFDLIKALTEQWSLDDRHTLFLVGDPMQSIYRFREAEVGLFLHCWESERLGAVKLTPLRLKTNFRTTTAVLDWIESRFAPMMPLDDLHQGAVAFRGSQSGRETAGPPPGVFAFIQDKGREEAEQIVRIIQANPQNRVAILVRSRGHAAKILPALRQAAIAYEAIEIEPLRDQQHIIDILSLTRALINVADRVSWLACLRAPWCGLTLQDLSAIAEGKRDQTILDLISGPETIVSLSVDGRWRLTRFQEVFTKALARVGRLPLRELVEQTWHQLGGMAATPANNQRDDIQTLFRLIDESDEGGVIRDYSLLNKRLEFLYARPSSTATNVSVMTIHQAKGLEFDTVIIPQIAAKPKSSDRELMVWAERETESGESRLQIAAVPQTGEDEANYKEISDVNKQKEENEINRLFYVACTRAINRLYLLGNADTKQRGAACCEPSTGSFLKLIWNTEKPTFEQELQRQFSAARSNTYVDSHSQGIPLRRLPLSWRAPALPMPVSPDLALGRRAPSDRQLSFRWVGDTGRHTGTVVHEILNQITAEGLDKWTDPRVLSLRGVAGSELLRLGVPDIEVPVAAKQVLRAVINTLNSRRGRWILSPHTDARSEWSITGLSDGCLISGTVDRAFRDDSGRYWIVDFKTGEHSGGSLQKFLAAEKERYQPQLDQYAAIVSQLVKSSVSLGLYFPLLDEWMEWHFTEAAATAS